MPFVYQAKQDHMSQKQGGTFIERGEFSKPEKSQMEIPIYILNAKCLKHRRDFMKKQFSFFDIKEEKLNFVEGYDFPSFADDKMKRNIIALNHVMMWEKALTEGCTEAIFLQDDVFLLKDWATILNNFLQSKEKKIHIVRFDTMPIMDVTDVDYDKNAIAYYNRYFACMGGMYLSKDAMTTLVTCFRMEHYYYVSVEIFLKEIIIRYFKYSAFDISPRLCIQNWFGGEMSSIQNDSHMEKLEKLMYTYYLKRFEKYYAFDSKCLEIIEKKKKEYTNQEWTEIQIIE